jgi:hypothetical protein
MLIKRFSPSLRTFYKNCIVDINDNSVLFQNMGNTIVKLDNELELEPKDTFFMPLTEIDHICDWRVKIDFLTENVIDNGAIKNKLLIVTTNFHGKVFSNL